MSARPTRAVATLLQIVLVLAVLVGGGAVAIHLIRTAEEAGQEPPVQQAVPVEVVEAAQTNERLTVSGMGTVRPAREVVLQAEVTGRIVEQAPEVVPGGRLQKGGLVARIDPEEYRLAVEMAKAELEKAEFELKVEEGRQVVARREWDLLESDVGQTEAGRELALRIPHLRSARAAVEAARSRLRQAQLDVEDTEITVPFNCLVQEEFIDVGQVVSPQTVLARLLGTDRFWVRVSVPVEHLQFINIPGVNAETGSTCRVIHAPNQAEGIRRSGRVVRLLGDLEPEGRMARLLVEVEDPLALNDPDALPLLVGAYVRAEIEGDTLRDVIRVPRQAVREGDEVWVVSQPEGRLEVRPVEIVWREKEFVLAAAGVREGDRMVISQIPSPVPGMQLREAQADPEQPVAESESE